MATTDIRLRQLICNLLATEDADSAAVAARAIDNYVDNHDRRRADLKNAANIMLEGRARPVTRQIAARPHLARWMKQ